MDQATAERAAQFLAGARTHADYPADMPGDLKPRSPEDVVAIQVATLALLGGIGGWKVGVADGQAVASPLPAPGIRRAPATIDSRRRGVEGEISFRFGRALPPADRPYDADAVIAAIDSCQVAIEILDPRFRDQSALDPLVAHADLGQHGGLVVGEPIAAWQPGMFATLGVDLIVNGSVMKRCVGSNPGGTDLVRLLVGLANLPVVHAAGGIKPGQVVTTGSWTGAEFMPPGAEVEARFDGFAPVSVRFAD